MRRLVIGLAIVAPAMLATGCGAARPPASAVVLPAGVRFQLAAADARQVAVAGTFNGWSTSTHPLRLDGTSGLWVATLSLPPGAHQYVYVIDGSRWIRPPLAEAYVADGFGSESGLVIVRPGGP